MAVIIGISILTNSPTTIDVSGKPKWFGYLSLYGGFILLFAFVVNAVYESLGVFKPRKKHNTLQDRISLAEQNQ